MSGKSKFFILFLPVVVVFAMVISFYLNAKTLLGGRVIASGQTQSTVQKGTWGKGQERKIASTDLSNNLVFALKKINEHGRASTKDKNIDTDKDKYSSIEYQEAGHNIDQVKNLYFFDKKAPNTTSFQNENKRIQEHVASNQELYNSVLSLKIQDALLDDNGQAIKELFAIAASLPLGQSPLQLIAEQILFDMTSTDRGWNEEIFRNAMQFYYIQNVLKPEKNDPLLVNLVEKCPDENLKQRILFINREINIYTKNNEEQNESHQ